MTGGGTFIPMGGQAARVRHCGAIWSDTYQPAKKLKARKAPFMREAAAQSFTLETLRPFLEERTAEFERQNSALPSSEVKTQGELDPARVVGGGAGVRPISPKVALVKFNEPPMAPPSLISIRAGSRFLGWLAKFEELRPQLEVGALTRLELLEHREIKVAEGLVPPGWLRRRAERSSFCPMVAVVTGCRRPPGSATG